MTIRSVGFDGSMSEADWSLWLAPHLGAPGMVARPGDYKVTPTTGLSIQVAPGVAHGDGVTDVSDAAEVIQLDTVSAGTRYDAIVLRRDWSGRSVTPTGIATGGLTYVWPIKGGITQTVPALTRNPGTIADQLLALVRVTAGAATVTVVDDARAVHARAAMVWSLLAMTGPAGTRYTLAPEGRRYVMAPNSSGQVVPVVEWEPPLPPPPVVPRVGSGTAAVDFNASGAAVITHRLGYAPRTVHVQARATSSSSLVEVSVSTAAGAVNATDFTIVAKAAGATGSAPYTGNLSSVDWLAIG